VSSLPLYPSGDSGGNKKDVWGLSPKHLEINEGAPGITNPRGSGAGKTFASPPLFLIIKKQSRKEVGEPKSFLPY